MGHMFTADLHFGHQKVGEFETETTRTDDK